MPRTIVVTGASRGLGAALAEGLAAAGWNVVIDARSVSALEATAARCRGGARVVPGDVTVEAHRDELARVALAEGGLDGVVLNAGTLGPSPLPALDVLELDDLRATFETNAVAPLALIQALLPLLRPGSAVAVVTSDAAVEAYPGWGAYGASKAALEQLARVLAVERPDLRVLRVDPGDLRTAMHQAAFPDEDISDRPEPETVVPALVALLGGAAPSGRYRLAELALAAGA